MSIFNGWRITRAGVVFVIGILVLAGLVFGGIMLVNQRGEQARRDGAVKIAEQQLKEQSEVAKENKEAVKADESQANQTATPVPSTPTAAELPATGIELSSIIAVSILALAGALYVTSRRAAREL